MDQDVNDQMQEEEQRAKWYVVMGGYWGWPAQASHQCPEV